VVGHAKGARWPCPECGVELCTYDHCEERAWRHLDSCGFTTWLKARPPRVFCPEHGVRQVALPWAEPHSRFTVLFERLAIDVLCECDISGACEILRISWDEGWHLMERAVARGQAPKARRVPGLIGVDEKAARKGHYYLTLVCDLERATVEYIADDPKQSSLDHYFEALTTEELHKVEAVAMDMWEPYVLSVSQHLPDAASKIVYDRFHIMKHMGESLDTVRKQEHRALRAQGLDILTGSKYLWPYSEENLPERHQERFASLRSENLKTSRAWAIKESLRALWHYRRPGWARRFWRQWYFWATHSRLQPVIDMARMLARHLQGVLNYFSAARITTPLPKDSTPRSAPSRRWPTDTATGSTSKPPSSSTAADSTSTRPSQSPTEMPDDPNYLSSSPGTEPGHPFAKRWTANSSDNTSMVGQWTPPGSRCSLTPTPKLQPPDERPDPWLGFSAGAFGRRVHPHINQVTAPLLLVDTVVDLEAGRMCCLVVRFGDRRSAQTLSGGSSQVQ
jgi:transposase